MRISIIVLLIFFFGINSFAQWAICTDKDFTNIREKPTTQSRIVDTLASGQIVFADSKPEGNWCYIEGDSTSQVGYINKTHLLFIEDLAKFKVVVQNDTLLKLRLDSISLTIKVGKFKVGQHTLKYQIENKNRDLLSIDNEYPLGVIDNKPINEYKYFLLKNKSKESKLNRKFWKDLYEPNLATTSAYLDKTNNIIYIEAGNSDGAGGYVMLLVISNDEIITKKIWTP